MVKICSQPHSVHTHAQAVRKILCASGRRTIKRGQTNPHTHTDTHLARSTLWDRRTQSEGLFENFPRNVGGQINANFNCREMVQSWLSASWSAWVRTYCTKIVKPLFLHSICWITRKTRRHWLFISGWGKAVSSPREGVHTHITHYSWRREGCRGREWKMMWRPD